MSLSQPLMFRTLRWMAAWPQFSVCLMVLAIILSSLGVIYSAHKTRQLYAELQGLQTNSDFLDSDYERLLLEQSAWAAYTRVDQVSHDELKMASPAAADIVVVTR